MSQDRKKFYCREWAFQKLSHCLDQRPISKTCGALLLGGPGCGKTTFCSELCWPSQGPSGRQQRALNRRLLCYHFLQGHNEKSLSLSEFVRSLVTQILNHSTESHKERSIRRKLADEVKKDNAYDTTGSTENDCSKSNDFLKSSDYSKLKISQDYAQENIYSNIYPENVLSPNIENKRLQDAPPPIPNLPVNPRTLIADAYLEKLKNDQEIQIALRAKNIEMNPDDCLKRALLFPLLEVDPPKTSLFILIDSIDEHSFIYSNSTLTRSKPRERSSQSRSIAELLANHHHLFPQWLLLVCTARKQSKSIAKMFTGFRKLSLDDLRKSQVVRDVQQYILARLDQENSLRQHISRDTAEMLNQLHIKSNGCFLYLEKVLDGVSDNFIVLREVREIPGTLNGLYLWLSQRLFNRRQFAKVQPLLNVILAAKCVLNETLLFDIVKIYNPKMTSEDFRKRFNLIKRILVISNNGAIRLFHHSFAEWLLDIKHCTQKYLCNIYQGHCILAMYYTLHAKYLSNQEIYDYAFHLTRMEQYLIEKSEQKCSTLVYKFSQERQNLTQNSLEKTQTEIYSDLKALQNLANYESEKEINYPMDSLATFETSFIETETSETQNNLDVSREFNVSLDESEYGFRPNLGNIELKSPVSDKNPIYSTPNRERNGVCIDKRCGEENVEKRCVDGGFVDKGYYEKGYVDKSYLEKRFTDDGYAELVNADKGYTEKCYVEKGFTDNTFGGKVFEDKNYGEGVYEEINYKGKGFTEEERTEIMSGEKQYKDNTNTTDKNISYCEKNSSKNIFSDKKVPCSDKNALYAEVRKDRKKPQDNANHTNGKTNNINYYINNDVSIDAGVTNDLNSTAANSETTVNSALDVHTLTVLWLIFSGCNVEECLLEGNEMAGVNFGAFLPTDQKVLKLLLEAGAVEQVDNEGCDYESQVGTLT